MQRRTTFSNTSFVARGLGMTRAVGDKQRAIADYRKAITLKDSYQAPRAALERLEEAP